MSVPRAPGSRRSRMGRYGPLVGIVGVVLAVVVLATLPKGPATEQSQPGTTGLVPEFRPVSFSEARAQRLEVEFGPGCDQVTGRIAIPSAFAAECFARRPGNGGATAQGVTAGTIRVVLYQAPPDPFIDSILAVINANDTRQQLLDTYRGFVDIYQRYYETYGRRVELIPFTGNGGAADVVTARADAIRIADEYAPFAVIGGPLLTSAFAEELAARGIIQIDLASARPVRFYEEHAPFIWNTLQAPDQTALHVIEYLAKRLAGRPAVHAGDPDLRAKTRRFGRFYFAPDEEARALAAEFERKARDAGIEFAASVAYLDPLSLQASAAQEIAKMKQAGVTTVLFTGDPLAPGPLTTEATAQHWFPEWIVTGSALVDSTTFARTYDQQQWAHAFGVSQLFARGLPEANFANGLWRWYYGCDPPAKNGSLTVYPSPTVLFSGIMAAGPMLTPQTFADGLFRAEPIGGGLTVPRVSFGYHGAWPEVDYTAIDDAVEIWWDATAQGPDERGVEGTGMYQYVDGGRRYLLGQWPESPPKAFDPEGAVTLYREVPPADEPPSYPPPADRGPESGGERCHV
ncbi:MAG: ABC transporter substrate-binding protein [Acidimicrobiales bacterium]|nr:ABC transporter substrate-binding protein [Acidimicrobiales bacterium]